MRRLAAPARVLLALALVLAGSTAASAQQDTSVIDTLRELATPGEHHAHLAALAGSWTASGTYWLPSGETATSNGTIENRWILGGLFLESHITAELLGETYEGRAIDGYDYITEQYMGSYVDNLGSFVLSFTGTCDQDGRVRTMRAEFIDPVWGTRMVNRSVTTIIDENTYRYESWLEHEDGREFKQMEFTATRVR
jgi:hypothetical protein